ncbi:MAG TPA: trehalase-like domain-containing protein, partial [Dyadobacter sp.]|nr:trehalase-like domain-containing protein [Dyadobacter sp.]
MNINSDNYQPIENYGVIGNMKTAALVGMDGSIDFLCFPAFDSPSIFAKILDHQKGGFFSIEPQMENVQIKQLYLPETAVLITRFFSEEGIAEIADYMPVRDETCNSYNSIVRKIKAVRGKIKFVLKMQPRFDYGRQPHSTTAEDNALFFSSDEDNKTRLRLQADFPLDTKDNDAYAEFELNESEKTVVVLECVDEGYEKHYKDLSFYEEHTYFQTIDYWRKWSNQSKYKGRWKEIVQRSAITLKLLTSSQYGSVVAAA